MSKQKDWLSHVHKLYTQQCSACLHQFDYFSVCQDIYEQLSFLQYVKVFVFLNRSARRKLKKTTFLALKARTVAAV